MSEGKTKKSSIDEIVKIATTTRPWTICDNCGERNYFERTDPIKCKMCNCRIVYKERSQSSQFYQCR